MESVASSPYNLLSSLLNSTRYVLEFARIRKLQDHPISTTPSPLDSILDLNVFTTPPPPSQLVLDPIITPTPSLNAATPTSDEELLPPPWGFFTSSYMIVIVLVAILTHRLQNVVLPSRPARRRQVGRPWRRRRQIASFSPSNLIRHMVPLDLTRTSTRFALHLPTLYLLFRSFLLWSVTILQVAGWFPQRDGCWPDVVCRVGAWGEKQDMSLICWGTFVACCASFFVESFVRALDGYGNGFMLSLGTTIQTSPLTLLEYAFWLYIYSFPTMHVRDGAHSPARVNIHAALALAIHLLQYVLCHVFSVSMRLSRNRLIPTAIPNILSLIHFNAAIIFHFFYSSDIIEPSPTSTAILTTTSIISSALHFTSAQPNPRITSSLPNITAKIVSPALLSSLPPPVYQSPLITPFLRKTSSYPLMHYLPNITETFLLLMLCVTVLLNGVIQLLVRGHIRDLFTTIGIENVGYSPRAQWRGLDTDSEDTEEQRSTGFIAFLASLPREEEFAVLLFRITTASIEATGLRGWGNEVAGLRVERPSRRSRRGQREHDDENKRRYGSLQLGHVGVLGGINAGVTVSHQPLGHTRNPSLRTTHLRGLNNEIRGIETGGSSQPGAGSLFWTETKLITEAWRLACAVNGAIIGAAQGLWFLGHNMLRTARKRWWLKQQYDDDEDDGPVRGRLREDTPFPEREKGKGVYERFLQGEVITDDEGAYSNDGTDDISEVDGWSEDDDTSGSYDQDEESDMDPNEPASLLADLLLPFLPTSISKVFGTDSDEPDTSSPHSPPAPSTSTPYPSASYNSGPHMQYDHDPASASRLALAHMSHPDGPLTRRRYSTLFNSTSSRRPGSQFSSARSTPAREVSQDSFAGASEGYDSDRGMLGGKGRELCVICIVEGREIVCWPCRCLAMCDGCRETLAVRNKASRHRCPCCRALVEGYSRIYVP
ncbi:hypothetical protein BDN72DRAFT_835757 [Pluteus cervinus]|uniref:Uncharacterized protein n=1 Tax=Pluteus cervinus TaxID=181527 RepID=A0ACD3B4G8_9AGAR|nr:hypothetical protein BDN72DRAFT_835757 [Pluteus cervinus]